MPSRAPKDRGQVLHHPGTKVYKGMIVGRAHAAARPRTQCLGKAKQGHHIRSGLR